jgi:hypothetical protein
VMEVMKVKTSIGECLTLTQSHSSLAPGRFVSQRRRDVENAENVE